MHNFKYLYHLTNTNRLKSIFSIGLKRNCGHHCRIINDHTKPLVFLCKEEDIEFWSKCFKDVDVVLKVNVENYGLICRKNFRYIEYGCFADIPADKISIWKFIGGKYNEN